MTAAVGVLMAFVAENRRREARRQLPMRLFTAMQAHDLAEMDRVLKTDPNLAHGLKHYTTSLSHTPLQRAILSGSSQVVDRILQEKPDLEEQASGGETALYTAVNHAMLSEVAKLLQLGAQVNVPDNKGRAPIHLAAYQRNQVLQLLIDNGADPNLAQPDGKTPLHLAAEHHNEVAIGILLQGGARVDTRDSEGRTPLHVALSDTGTLKAAQLLVDAGADLTATDRAGLIPGQKRDGSNSEIAALIWWELIVKAHDKDEIAKLNQMLDAAPQAFSFRTGYTPKTPLQRAVHAKRMDILNYLLARRLKAELQDKDLDAALQFACWDPIEFAERLLDAGADVKAQDELGQTALHLAAIAGRADMLRLFLAKGANIAALDNDGTTVLDALFERSFHRSSGQKTLKLLLEAGHSPTLLSAAALGDLDLLRQLSGDDLDALNRAHTRSGVRPLHAAVLGGQGQVVEWLIERGVDCDDKSDHRRIAEADSPLMTALSTNQADIAILLIHLGADVNNQGKTGFYPVHAVIAWDRGPKLLEALMAHGADLSFTHQKKSTVELARTSKSQHRARYLELLGASKDK